MRQIGVAGIECIDDPCLPWSKFICKSCAIRPMKVYQTNGNSQRDRKICREYGFGVLMSPGGCSTPQHFPYYALDNGCFGAYINGSDWDETKFLKLFEKYTQREKKPDFVVVPDLVGRGEVSLRFSLGWLLKLQANYGSDWPYFIAVQDGMHYENVEDYICGFAGIFVGGTIEWKDHTAEQWIRLAHKYGKPCHIGRVGTWRRIAWANRIGADSIDSSSWAQNDSYEHLFRAMKQTDLMKVQT